MNALAQRSRYTVFCLLFLAAACSVPPAPPASSKIAFAASEGIDGSWESLGFKKGEHIPNFMLYAQDGTPFQLYKELERGKPVVLINGSYTCDVSRANLPAIKSITSKYKDELSFFMVYTVDAHPADTISPYSAKNEIWIAESNTRDSVAADQPKTYGERVALSKQWQQENGITAPVLVDSPENVYWIYFGQAPNMAYIIEPDGTVYYKQSWFRKEELEEHIKAIVE